MSDSGHSTLGPSGAARWLNCTASPHLVKALAIEEESGAAAKEGTYCHSVMEALVLNNCRVDLVGAELEAALAAVKAEIDADIDSYDINEMTRDLDGLMQHLYQLEIRYPDLVIYCEKKVHMQPITIDVWGTADLIAYSRDGDFLQVIDLKYGRVYVEEKQNTQLTLYFIAALLSTLRGVGFPRNSSFVIYQPRGGGEPLREFAVDPDYIKTFVDRRLRPSLAEYDAGGQYRIGPWCEWCPALSGCPTARAELMEIAQMQFEDMTKEQEAAAIKKVLDFKKPILKLIEDAETKALAALTIGQEIEGYKLVASKTQRKWAEADDVIIKFLREKGKFKLKDVQTKKLLTLTAAEKLVKSSKHIDIEDLQAYITKPAGTPTLAPESDRRPAITVDPFEDLTDKTDKTDKTGER